MTPVFLIVTALSLYTRPIRVRAFILALFALPTAFDIVAMRTSAPKMEPRQRYAVQQQQLQRGPAYHPTVRRQGNPIILSASFVPPRELHINSKYAVWLELPRAQATGPTLGVYRFSDRSTRSIQLPFFADSQGNNGYTTLYLASHKVVALGSTRIAAVDLDTGAVSTAGFKGQQVGGPPLVYVNSRYMVYASFSGAPALSIVDLKTLSQRSLNVTSVYDLRGITKDSLVEYSPSRSLTPMSETYTAINLATLSKKVVSISVGNVWWMPQAYGTVDEDRMVAPHVDIEKICDVDDGLTYKVSTGILGTGMVVAGNSLFWERSGDGYDGSALLRTNYKTGLTERVLNAPPRLDIADHAMNDRYFLKIVQQNESEPSNPADIRTYPALNASNINNYPILLELVRIQATAISAHS